MVSSAEYFRMRASHCRMMAGATSNLCARRIHEELAQRYARQANEAEAAAHAKGTQRATSLNPGPRREQQGYGKQA